MILPDAPHPRQAWDRLRSGGQVSMATLVRLGLRDSDPRSRMVTILNRWERGGLVRRADRYSYVMTDAGLSLRDRGRAKPAADDRQLLRDEARAAAKQARAAATPRQPGEEDQDWAWRVMRMLKISIAATDLPLSARRIRALHSHLEYWRRLELVTIEDASPESYKMTMKGRALAKAPSMPPSRPPAPRSRSRMWVAMRILKQFDAAQLGWSASVSPRTATVFCRVLTRAGYLTVIGGERDGEPVWCLSRFLGPAAPLFEAGHDGRTVALFDPNTDSRVKLAPRSSLFLTGSVNHVE